MTFVDISGFSIAGGKGHTPFVEGTDGIFISRITEGGIAHRDGKVQVGDRIVAVRINYIFLHLFGFIQYDLYFRLTESICDRQIMIMRFNY